MASTGLAATFAAIRATITKRAPRGVVPNLWMLPVLGALIIVAYAASRGSWTVLAVASATGAAALAFGGIVGFLFGIPRTLTSEAAGTPQREGTGPAQAEIRSNTNLEQISDWLTKIIVGVGLVELGSIRASIASLVDYLAPALGTGATAEPFTFCLLAYFSIAGFLAGYLITRIVLQHEFAVAERDIAAVAGRVAQEVVESRDQADAEALRLLTQQLDVREPPVTQAELDRALSAATEVTKQVAFNRARQQRVDGWKKNDSAAIERTIPVYRSLVAADKEAKYHRNHAELGYALKDQRASDWAAAEEALDCAIRIRDQRRIAGWKTYEFHRALCRVERDANFLAGRPAAPEQRAEILSDITAAMKHERSRAMVQGSARLKQWADLQDPRVDLSTL